jgi:regulator of cell morphogenesis and NO signaling
MIDVDAPVADLVLAHSGTAIVLDRRHIDYCCEGHRPLAQVIAERGLDRAQLVAELALAMQAPDPEADPRTASTASLISRALARQHRNLRASLALLEHHAFTVVKEHGARFPTVRTLANGIGELVGHMLPHLDREEDELFPALLERALSVELRGKLGTMFDEHRDFTLMFRRLRASTSDYRPPDGADDEVVALYAGVHELEGLVARHHHVENHVLLPRFR